MYTSRQKIHKDKDAEPEFEEFVAQVMLFSLYYDAGYLRLHLILM